MKCAFSTLACTELPFAEVLALAKRTGMEAVEIRLDRENLLCGYPMEKLPQAKRMLDESGLVICDVGSGISIKTWDESCFAPLGQCAQIASIMGARGVRVFLGDSARRHSDPVVRDIEGVARTLRRCAEIVRPYGVEIWLETHSNFSTGAVMREVLDLVGYDEIQVLWDIMHSIEWGESPAETVKALGKSLVHVHLKDGARPQDPDLIHYTLTKMGEGEVRFEEIASALKSIGYDGYLSLEWEQAWHPELSRYFPSTDALLMHYHTFLNNHF